MSAQTPVLTSDEAVAPIARKLDEFGRLGGCDHTARLDHLAVELSNEAGSQAVLIAYGPQGDVPGTALNLLLATKDYLVNSRGIDPARVTTINGGRLKTAEVKTELWIVPEGALMPEPTAMEETNADAPQFSGKVAEFETDESWYQSSVDSGLGISFGNPNLAGFADTLRQQPSSRGYIIAYASKENMPGADRRVAKYQEGILRETYGVEAGRLTVIAGGRDKESHVELWILPPNVPPPASVPNEQATPVNSFRLGAFDRYKLQDEADARWIRDGLADMLRRDERAHGYIIVRLPALADENSEGELPEKENASEVPDLSKAAHELAGLIATENSMKPGRVTVLIGRSGEYESGTLETWFVPYGVAPPDADKLESEDVEEISEETSDLAGDDAKMPPPRS